MKAKSSFAFFRQVFRMFYYSAPIILTCSLCAATNDLSGLLQKGLFEEEANRNLEAASAAYQTLVTQFDKNRQIGATAIFRLGEVYRKQGKTNEAAVQYERIVRDFAEQTTLVTLSRQNLAGLRPSENRSNWTPSLTSRNQVRDDMERLYQKNANLIASYQALPQTNRLDSLCFIFDEVPGIGSDCAHLKECKKRIQILMLDGITTNHPTIVKLQAKISSLETKIETDAKEQIEKLIPFVASLEKELQRRESEAAIASTSNPDLAQLKKLSRAELLQVLPTLAPDQLLTKLLEQRNTTQTKHAEASHDLGPNSPEIKKLVALRELLEKQIDERVAGILKAMELRVGSKVIGEAPKPSTKPDVDANGVFMNEDDEIRRLQTLIQNSPDLINGSPQVEGPLLAAARAGKLRVATFLLDNKADVNVVFNRRTPLHNAVQYGQKAMVELLLQRGANMNAKDGTGGTALHEAAKNGFLSIVEVLLAHKADLNARNNESNGEQTPLHLAAGSGHTALVGFLLENGDDVNRKDAHGQSPLQIVASQGRDGLVERLLKGGAAVNAVDENGATSLIAAAARGHLVSVKALLAAKANPDVVDLKGRTALSYAVDSGHVQTVQTLLDAGANPDLGKLDLPLLVAVRGQKPQIAELLLSRGADPNLESKSPVQINGDQSFSGGRQPVGSGRPPFGPYQPLQAAVARKDAAMVTLLLKWKADPNIKQNSTWLTPVSPLLFSVLDNEAMLQAFLEAGADANVRSSINDTPALVSTAQYGQPEAVRLLLNYKARIDATDGIKNTALHYAAQRGDLEMTKLLLAHQPDLNATNTVHNTPLHGAVWVGQKEIVALLLEHEANPNVRSASGLTPLDYTKSGSSARSTNNRTDEVWREIGELLRKHGALDVLPDFTRIRITRQGLTQPLAVFFKGAKLTNQFTLLESVISFYNKPGVAANPGLPLQPVYQALPFPDFGRIIIRRPALKPGGKEQEIKVNLLNGKGAWDCANDVPVAFGDVIEIPERVHALNEAPENLVQEIEKNFTKTAQLAGRIKELTKDRLIENDPIVIQYVQQKAEVDAAIEGKGCLRKSVQLVIAGNSTPLVVDSWKEGFLNQALAKVESRAALRSSSDLSRIKVTRKDAKTGKSVVLIVDATSPNDNLWLQSGDVIDVPDKP